MTTTTKPLPPHGTTARYKAGCHEECCLAADRRDRKRRELFGSFKSQPNIVAPHLRRFLDAGASIQSIAKAADCDRGTVRQILNGAHEGIWQSTAARILAVVDAELTASVPALASTRQVRALMAARHSLVTISAASGLDRAVISELANGRRDTVRATTAVAVRNAYARLANTTGISVRAGNRAAREGWANPAAWDGIDMSDPGAFPDWTGRCGTVQGFNRHLEQGIPTCLPCENAEAALRAKKARCAA